ncbi:hypothetical protein [Bradyrhizobium sp. 186]|uniref:DUF6894 family protein n=1 Tax=Bradyrhizobium sp. 186 TaxID=2782654 RepID=UPI003211C1FA
MPRYYFDLHEGDWTAVDEEGLELSGMHAVQAEAAKSLADMAREAVHRAARTAGHCMAMTVRDEAGPLMQGSSSPSKSRKLHIEAASPQQDWQLGPSSLLCIIRRNA